MPRPLCFTLLLLTQLLPFTIAQSIISPRADPPSCGTNYTTYTYCTSLLIDPTVGGSDGNGIDFKPGDVYNSKLQFCEKLADVLKKEGVDVKNLKTRKVEGGEGSVERGEGLWASAGGRGVGRRDVVQVPFCCLPGTTCETTIYGQAMCYYNKTGDYQLDDGTVNNIKNSPNLIRNTSSTTKGSSALPGAALHKSTIVGVIALVAVQGLLVILA